MNKKDKSTVQFLVREAVRKGLLIKPNRCDDCNKKCIKRKLAGHHEDYSKVYEVSWLCHSCHRNRHKNIYENVVGEPVKLTHKQVLEIRSKYVPYKVTAQKLAKEYGVSFGHISKIIRGETRKLVV